MRNTVTTLIYLIVVFAIPLAAALDREALLTAISGSDRDPADLARDEARKPVEVLDFFGIELGMKVLDVYAAGGYYTFILSKAVGDSGTVIAQNTPSGLSVQEGRQNISQGEAFENKVLNGQLLNVIHRISSLDQLELEPESLDFILMSLILHDFYNNNNADRALERLQQFMALLKPGGIIGITDHVGLLGQDNNYMHRMPKEEAVALIERAGYLLVEESDLLKNTDDDHFRHIFHPSLGRNTDRFILKIQKPE